jgi:ABC-2 type transport system permease protein
MTHLLKTEWLKIRKYKAFWWLMALTILSYPGINFIFYQIYKEILQNETQLAKMAKMLIGSPFAFPDVWHTEAYGSSIFVFIPAVLVIMFITNEYTFKTHRQNVIDGWSRSEFLTGKMLNVIIISLLITALYIIVCVTTGLFNNSDSTAGIFSGIGFAGRFALQTFAQLSIAFLIGFLIRKAFISLGVFIFYFLIFEPILVQYGKVKLNDVFRYMPLEVSDRIIPLPAFLGRFNQESYNKALSQVNTHIILTIGLTALIWWICYRINNKRDL